MAEESYKEMFERLGEDEVRRGVEGKLPYPWSPRRIRAGKEYLIEKERGREERLKRTLRGEPSVEGLTPAPVVEPIKLKNPVLATDKSCPAQERVSLADRVRKSVLGDEPQERVSLADLVQESKLRSMREEKGWKQFIRRTTILGLIVAAAAVVISILRWVFG